ncbi:MAG: DUF885 domain-containing protein [Blastocatellia bacterium]|nr:DUF885 domain-containing protein [Blastocatellia bacterium]
MRRNSIVICVLSAAIISGNGFLFASRASAASGGAQNNAAARSARSRSSATARYANLNDLSPEPSEVRGAIERYMIDFGSLNRFYTAPLSPTRDARLKQFYTEWLAGLERMNFDAMSHDGRIDYLLFKNQLDYELRQVDIRAKQFAEMQPLLPFAGTIIELEESRRRMEPVDSAKLAALLTNLNKQIEETRKAVEAGLKPEGKPDSKSDAKAENKITPIKVKKTVANRAAVAAGRLKETLKRWVGFYNGYDPVFTWWTGDPYKRVDQTLQNYAAFLREKVIGVKPDDKETIIGDPIGREALLVDLAYEMIPYTPEELIAIANKEMAWCENEMLRASRELGYGDDWHKALEYVKTLHVEPGKQPELIKELALEAIEFVEKHDLLTVPQLARDTWRMEMMSPERQLVNPFFTGGETISVSYPTNTMTHEQKLMSMRGNNIHFSRATVHHELIPGHHLQGFMTARHRSYRRPFSTPFWGEGWALYWELLLWDMNFAKSPENRIGMLFWRMHRCARIIFSLSFHLEKMTPKECIDLLVNRVGHELENATAEVRRSFLGTYSPLYQCAYLLGGLQFRALHKELVGSGKMTNRDFHDAILKENRIPVEMVRAVLTRQPLKRDFASNWKFYGENPAGR